MGLVILKNCKGFDRIFGIESAITVSDSNSLINRRYASFSHATERIFIGHSRETRRSYHNGSHNFAGNAEKKPWLRHFNPRGQWEPRLRRSEIHLIESIICPESR
jgi:hypothetical protein